MTKYLFRILIILRIVFIAAGIGVSYIPNMITPALARAYYLEPAPWLEANMGFFLVIAAPIVLSHIIGIFGLYFFKRWGRGLSTYTTIILLALSLLIGPSVESALASALLDISVLLWGAILALSYFSPISTLFANASTSKP